MASSGHRKAARAGRYEYISQISVAPLGNLWAARCIEGPEYGRVVAVRRIPREPPIDDDVVERVRRSAVIGLGVRHPQLAALLDLIVTPREIAVVNEYVDGEFLRSVQRRTGLKNSPFSDRVALRLGLDLVEGAVSISQLWDEVAAGVPHGAPRIHGGLTADTILVAVFGEPVFYNIGVAAALRTHPLLTNHPDVLPYSAPEQILGHPADERTDVFIIGTLLWELLANRALFGSPRWTRYTTSPAEAKAGLLPAQSRRAAALRKRVLESKIARLDALVRVGERIATPVAEVVGRALERDPARRYATLREFAEALRALGEPTYSAPEEVASFLHEVAGTSIEARRAALASVFGQAPKSDRKIDSDLPTLPPRASLPHISEVLDAEESLRSEAVPDTGDHPSTTVSERTASPDTPEQRPARKKPPLPPRKKAT